MKRFVILPAAGRSRRMGEPKLLLPWGSYRTMLEATLASWQATRVDEIVVVTHPDDNSLQRIVREVGATLVVPATPPPEMKVSIRAGLDWLAANRRPCSEDVWFLSPADMPHLAPEIVVLLGTRHGEHPEAIIVPCHAGRRGHPVLFPWRLAAAVAQLGPDEGVNGLLQRHQVVEVLVPDEQILEDVDTPEDYRRLRPGTS
jgi:molybdenum cofactor cytidylyltransferase